MVVMGIWAVGFRCGCGSSVHFTSSLLIETPRYLTGDFLCPGEDLNFILILGILLASWVLVYDLMIAVTTKY